MVLIITHTFLILFQGTTPLEEIGSNTSLISIYV